DKFTFMKTNTSKGAVSSIILILAVVLLVVIVIVFFVTKSIANKNAAATKAKTTTTTTVNEPPKPVYETSLGDIQFTFEDAVNLGNVLVPKSSFGGQNLVTTEKYVRVTIGAQNQGKVNIDQGTWMLGNIVDADGRNFVTIDNQAYSFLPSPNLCGALLKPDFAPTPCVSYYDVARASTKLKIQVVYTPAGSSKKQTALLDLQVR
ncbi:MAG: hypothetical protein ACHQVK_05010, partial [Candidatus Paceibacterales bacterium]